MSIWGKMKDPKPPRKPHRIALQLTGLNGIVIATRLPGLLQATVTYLESMAALDDAGFAAHFPEKTRAMVLADLRFQFEDVYRSWDRKADHDSL